MTRRKKFVISAACNGCTQGVRLLVGIVLTLCFAILCVIGLLALIRELLIDRYGLPARSHFEREKPSQDSRAPNFTYRSQHP
jgi:hypothetical protein